MAEVGGDVRATQNATASPAITLTLVPTGATIVVCFTDRTGGMTVSAVSSNVDGTFGAVHTEIVHSTTFRDVMFRRHNCTAGTHIITGTLGVSQNTQVVACWVDPDNGQPMQDDVVGTPLDDTSADTTHTSTSASATSQPGAAIYLIETGSSQGAAPTSLSAGTVLTTAVEAGMRSFLVGEAYITTGSKSFTATMANSTADRSLLALFKEQGGVGTPAITTVDADDAFTQDDTSIPIVGTAFSTATVDLEQTGGVDVAQSIGSQSATLITLSSVTGFASGGAVKNGSATLRVTNVDTATDTQTVTITPPSGTAYVDLLTAAVSGQKITATGTLASGDQVEYRNVTGGGFTIADVTIYDDHTASWTSGVTGWEIRAYDNTAKEWSAWVSQTVQAITGRNFRRPFNFNWWNS